jgi:chloramphenicol 3-O-phosphotransferase
MEVPLLLLCGASGAGKSSVAWEIYLQLMRARASIAHVDLDGIGYGPPGHSGSFELKFQNVAAVWRCYAGVGAHAFIVSGLRALPEVVEACTAAVPQSVPTAVVLTLTAEEQRERIVSRAHALYALARGGGSSAQTPEALEQTVAAAAQELEDEVQHIPGALTVATVGVDVPEVARQILVATGWPGHAS